MKTVLTLILILLSVNLGFAKDREADKQTQEESSEKIEEPEETIDDLNRQLRETKKDKDKVDILAKMLLLQIKEINTLSQSKSQLDSQAKNLKYLTDSDEIFTTPLPDSTEVHPVFIPVIRSINTVNELKAEIKNTNDMLANLDKEYRNSRNKTYDELLNTPVVQEQVKILQDKAILVDSMDKTIFTETQRAYIDKLIQQYNNLMGEIYK